MPSSSCTASSSTSPKDLDLLQQHKPPKKRKYTTEDITQTQDDSHPQIPPTKPTNQFISEYYSNCIGQARSEQPQSINKILARSEESLLASSNTESNDKSKSESYSNENHVHNNNNNKKKRSSSSNLVGLLVTS